MEEDDGADGAGALEADDDEKREQREKEKLSKKEEGALRRRVRLGRAARRGARQEAARCGRGRLGGQIGLAEGELRRGTSRGARDAGQSTVHPYILVHNNRTITSTS